jgi:hypothetical protein
MTLVEVIAGMALLASVLVAMLLARAGYMRQTARANRRLEAVAAADALLTAWHRDPATLHPGSGGPVAGDGQLAWRTRLVASAEAESLGARVVRLEVLDERPAASPSPVLATVEFLVEPENHEPLAPAATQAVSSGGQGTAQQGKHRGIGKPHAPSVHTP